MKNRLKNLYKIKISNTIYIIICCITMALFFDLSKYIFSNLLNIHLGLNFEIDFMAIYAGFLTLILPVAILIIERIENLDNAIISETYLRETAIFPVIVYFVVNLLIFAFNNNQYFFIVSSIISTVLIVYMYYKSFKMISNLIYEKEKIGIVNEEVISNDLVDQTTHFSEDNKITIYQKYGVYVGRYNYFSTEGYKKKTLYPTTNCLMIKQYNYRVINKLIKKLKIYNKLFIDTYIPNEENVEYSNDNKPNVIVVLSDIGSTLNKNNSWISIYYKNVSDNDVKMIIEILKNKVYITSESNSHLYIEVAYKGILKDCIESINSNSSSLLSENLERYLEIYKNYINEFSSKIGSFTYEESYSHINSFIRFRGMDFLTNVQKNIYDYSSMILEKNNARLMNSLISFLYSVILYSYQKKELLSIQLLYCTYEYLCECSLKLNDNSSFEKIKLEIFEFMNMIKYDIPKSEDRFEKDVLLVCNRVIGNIIFNLSRKDEEKCLKFYKKIFNYINEISEELDSVDCDVSDKNMMYHNTLTDIYDNLTCNIFAVTAYAIQKNKNLDVEKLLLFYDKIDVNSLSNILTKSIYFDYNNRNYSWDLMDMDNIDDDGVYNINTTYYFIHLYCLLISRKNINSIKIKSTFELSNQSDSIISELKNMNKEEYIELFENVKSDVEKEEKEYIRKTPISPDKIENFKNKFFEYYDKHNRLVKLFNITDNLKIIKRKKKGKNYLGIRNIVDKTYFLEKTPNNRCIIWSNFEENYASSFINSEENKFAIALNNNSSLSDKSIIDYLQDLSIIKLKKSILFSDYETIHKIFGYSNISYKKEDNKEYANLFVMIKGIYVPIIVINGIDENCIYHVFDNKIGKLEKLDNSFEIEIIDFYNNDELLKKCMNEKINGLDLTGIERKNHLLESVDLFIQEYIHINVDNLISLKFDH